MFKEKWGKSVWRYNVSNGLQSSRITYKSTRINEEFLSGESNSVKSKILLGGEKKRRTRIYPCSRKIQYLKNVIKENQFQYF